MMKTRFWGILICLTHSPEFLIAIFEFFEKNAADWWWKCFEIRIFDIGKFALKFQI